MGSKFDDWIGSSKSLNEWKVFLDTGFEVLLFKIFSVIREIIFTTSELG